MKRLHYPLMKKGHFARIALFMFSFFPCNAIYCSNELISNACTSEIPGWILHNNITTNPIQKDGYWLLEAGASSDCIFSPTIDAGNYTNLNLSFNIATYESGSVNPVRISYSTDGGATWASNTITSTPSAGPEFTPSGEINLGTLNTKLLVLRFSNNGTTGRDIKIKDISLTGTPIITTPIAKPATNITYQSFDANWTSTPEATGYILHIYKSTNIINENFTTIAASSSFVSSGSGASGSLSFGSSGWSATYGYSAGGVIRIGTGTTAGSLNSPPINISGKFMLTFKSCAWSNDSKNIDIFLNGTLLQTINLEDNIVSADLMKEYTIRGEGTGNDIITFSAKKNSNNRFFIDDVCIRKTVETTDSPQAISSGETTTKTITPLNAGSYYYTVKATNNIYTSDESDMVQATISSTNDIPQIKQNNTPPTIATTKNLIIINNAFLPNTIEIYNATGELIKKFKTPVAQISIPLPSGIYLIKTDTQITKVIVR